MRLLKENSVLFFVIGRSVQQKEMPDLKMQRQSILGNTITFTSLQNV